MKDKLTLRRIFMEHREIAGKLGAFLDNELPEGAGIEVKAHLDACNECSKEYKALVSQREYMRKAPVLEAGTDFRFKITQKIEMQKVSKPVYGFGKWLPAPLAFAALILVFSAYMIAAPVAFGMGNNALKTQAKNMAVNAVLACTCGSLFAPAAFAKFCGVCTTNACACVACKCGPDCKMNMKTGGNGHGN
jgi:anti-sigma factor RsiW